MFNGDREQHIGITHGPDEFGPEALAAKLQRLDEAWKYYRESGSGRVLSEDKAQVVYMLAKYFTITRGSGMGEDEAVAKVGFSYEDCHSKLKSLELTGHQRAGLWTRVESLYDFAEGIKPIREPGSRRTSSFSDGIFEKVPDEIVSDNERRQQEYNAEVLNYRLKKLNVIWEFYRTKGPGRSLDESEAQIVYKHARLLTASRGSHLPENEIKRIVGVSWDEILEAEQGIDIGRRYALSRRGRSLMNMALGLRDIPWRELREQMRNRVKIVDIIRSANANGDALGRIEGCNPLNWERPDEYLEEDQQPVLRGSKL